MKIKKFKNSGNHIKVQNLRNGEMRAVRGGTEYTCGGGSGDDCTKLAVHVPDAMAMAEKADLLSVYK